MPIYHCAQGILVHVFLHVFFIPPTCMYVRTNERTHSRAQIHRSATITRQEINGQAHKSEKANVDMLTEGSLIAIESDQVAFGEHVNISFLTFVCLAVDFLMCDRCAAMCLRARVRACVRACIHIHVCGI